VVESTAAASLIVGMVVSGIATFIYGTSMFQNLVAGLAGTLVTVGLTILGLDRVITSQRRRQWTPGYEAIAGLLAQTFVDIMRLLFVRSANLAYRDNHPRWSRFVRLAEMHLAALSGAITALATVLDPESFLASRSVEHRLRWMLNRIATDQGRATSEPMTFDVMYDTSIDLGRFLQEASPGSYKTALLHSLAATSFVLNEVAGRVPTMDDVFRFRLGAQQHLFDTGAIEARFRETIADDVDNHAALHYFAIDKFVLAMVHDRAPDGAQGS
jgi:hypothetical protein